MRRAPPGWSSSAKLVGIGLKLLRPTAKIYMATDGRNRRNDNSDRVGKKAIRPKKWYLSTAARK